MRSRTTEVLLWLMAWACASAAAVYAVNGLTRHDAEPVVRLVPGAAPSLPGHAVEPLTGDLARVWVADLSRVQASLARVGLWGPLLLVGVLAALLAAHVRWSVRLPPRTLVTPGPFLLGAALLALVLAIAQPLLQRAGADLVLSSIGSPAGYVPWTSVPWLWPAAVGVLLLGTQVPRRHPV